MNKFFTSHHLEDDKRIPFVDPNLFERCYNYLSTNYSHQEWIFSVKDYYYKKDYPNHASTFFHLLISRNGSIALLFYREISDGNKGLFGESEENLSNPQKFKEIMDNHIYISNTDNILEEENFFFNFLRFSTENNPGYLKLLTLTQLQRFLGEYQNERIRDIEIKILEPYSKELKKDEEKTEKNLENKESSTILSTSSSLSSVSLLNYILGKVNLNLKK